MLNGDLGIRSLKPSKSTLQDDVGEAEVRAAVVGVEEAQALGVGKARLGVELHDTGGRIAEQVGQLRLSHRPNADRGRQLIEVGRDQLVLWCLRAESRGQLQSVLSKERYSRRLRNSA